MELSPSSIPRGIKAFAATKCSYIIVAFGVLGYFTTQESASCLIFRSESYRMEIIRSFLAHAVVCLVTQGEAGGFDVAGEAIEDISSV